MGIVMFNGRSSRDIGLEVETFPNYIAPEKIYDIVHVPGRNGDLVIDTKTYKNVPREYKVSIATYNRTSYSTKMSQVAEWLYSASGYARLEDSYDEDFYRLAYYNNETNIDNLFNEAGKATLKFICKPQRYFKSGEIPILFESAGAIQNETIKKAFPILNIVTDNTEGTISIGNYSFEILEGSGTHIIMDQGEGIPYALEPMYISEGKDYISDDGTTADGYVNSDESVKTTAFLADLIAKGYANVDPITDEFLNGACATELGGSWDVATLEANATFDWGVTYYPVADDTHKAVSPCGDWSAAISKDCENVEATGEFLKWLMNTENVASYADAIAKPATRASAYDEECMASYAEGPRALFVEQLQNSAAPRPRTPSYATFSTDYAEAMSNIFSEAASTKAVDETYIKEQLDSVADSFAEDYNTYYAN